MERHKDPGYATFLKSFDTTYSFADWVGTTRQPLHRQKPMRPETVSILRSHTQEQLRERILLRFTDVGWDIATRSHEAQAYHDPAWELLQPNDKARAAIYSIYYLRKDGKVEVYVGQGRAEAGYYVFGGDDGVPELRVDIDDLELFGNGAGARATASGPLFGAGGRVFRHHLSKKYREATGTQHYELAEHATVLGAYKLWEVSTEDHEFMVGACHLMEFYFICVLRSSWTAAFAELWGRWQVETRRSDPLPCRVGRRPWNIECGLEADEVNIRELYLLGFAIVSRSALRCH